MKRLTNEELRNAEKEWESGRSPLLRVDPLWVNLARIAVAAVEKHAAPKLQMLHRYSLQAELEESFRQILEDHQRQFNALLSLVNDLANVSTVPFPANEILKKDKPHA